MKAIIVDDELHVKDAIKLMIDWEKYGIDEVLYAPNGVEALKLIEEKKPEVMFCDMEMPLMGGEALLREVIKREIKIQVIAVSGYSDFNYVHTALLAKGVDYILKPFSEAVLVTALEKAMAHIQGQKKIEAESRHHEQMGVALANQLLQRFCKGEVLDHKEIFEAFNKLNAKSEKFLLISILNRNATPIIEERYEGNSDLFFFTVGNILRDFFGGFTFLQSVFIDEYNWQLLLQDDILDLFKVTNKMKMFEKKIYETLELNITWVVSRVPAEINELQQIVLEQNGILQRRSVWEANVVEQGKNSFGEEEIPGVLSLELRILSTLESRDQKKLEKVIEEFCDLLRKRKQLRLSELQNCTADMNLLFYRVGLAQSLEFQMEPISQWMNDINIWEKEVIKRFEILMNHFTVKKDPAEKILSYIREHYSENITLSSISSDFYQTPQYVARIFKNKYNKTIMTAITEVRMEKACELLGAGNKNVAQVAELVGYEDENYFVRVFKKNIGITPAQFRRKKVKYETD